ncbi:ATP-binding protein [Streptomyces sp. TRM66268-LWL]|uniref:ATP-binding protein n=1 Tax=Streptomyces polyasparticus TaxID=2767826 RepID=A0ABR7SGR9_9ACTN|nr:ATP-binding protein [Streptomyces polyasparticus]MBC9713935.1 ATP-binding protein [Streptomyces polyasparticus]
MTASQSAHLTLASVRSSVREARLFTAQTLSKWGLPDDSETHFATQLIVSELATNAVLHTCGLSPTFTVCLVLDEKSTLHVRVTDSHPDWPRHLPAAEQHDSGRGMAIVRTLTAERGGRLVVQSTDEGGKAVHVSYPCPEAAPRHLAE